MTTETTTETTELSAYAKAKLRKEEKARLAAEEAKNETDPSESATETQVDQSETQVDQSETQSDTAVETPTIQADPRGLTLGIFKLNEHTKVPTYGTKASACFDIRVNLMGLVETQSNPVVDVVTKNNQFINRRVVKDNDGRYFVELRQQERMIAPTGAIFDIPLGYSLKVHPRSGTSLKQGLNLINQEAVIDADYVDELKLLLVNSSDTIVRVYHDERYAQGELQELVQHSFAELAEAPAFKTDRTGGLGHTGTK